MSVETEQSKLHRRALLKYLASSPLLGSAALQAFSADLFAVDNLALLKKDIDSIINKPNEAINLFDFERKASHTIPTSHFGYLTTGVDDDITKLTNHQAYAKYYLRPRRLVDVRKIDTSIKLFGENYASPIFVCPVGSHKAFHSEGEVAVARAAKKYDFPMMLSTMASTAIEEVVEAREKPIIYQLYPTSNWNVTKQLLRRAESAGCKTVVLTVDLPTSNRETLKRLTRQDDRDCSSCHGERKERTENKPMFMGTGMKLTDMNHQFLNWDFVKRLKDETSMALVLKGIVTKEDAQLGLDHGVNGIVVSNHGGRADESGRGTIDSLAEIMPTVGNKIPVLIDGGVRRGTDVFKALALGASAVGIGRPYMWGLGSFGQEGVEKVLHILLRELEFSMKLAGTTNIDRILAPYVGIK